MKTPIAQASPENHASTAGPSGPRARATKDAITVLREDHADMRTLLRVLRESSERAVQKRERLLGKVATALWVQMQVEEEIFYAAFEGALSTTDDEVRALEARAEHESVKAALRRLEGCEPASLQFRAMAKVVHDLVDHHARGDESETFPRARAIFSPAELLRLGERIVARKHELVARRAPAAPLISA